MAKQPKRFTDLVDEIIKENKDFSLDNMNDDTDLGAEANKALEDGLGEGETVSIEIPKHLVSALKEIVALFPADEVGEGDDLGDEGGEGDIPSLDDVEDGLDDLGADDVGLGDDELKREEDENLEDEEVVEEECEAKKAPAGKPNKKPTVGRQEELKQKHQTVKKPSGIATPKAVKK